MNMRKFVWTMAILITFFLALFIFLSSPHSPLQLNQLFQPDTPGAGDQNDHFSAETKEEEKEPETYEPDIRQVSFLTLGNIIAHQPQIEQADSGNNRYDFSPSFDFIASYLQKADIVVGDLETAQADPETSYFRVSGYTGWPLFNAPGEFTEALADAGVNVLTLANNHVLDRGLEGLSQTIDHIRSHGITTFGAYKSWEEYNTPVIVEHNGIRIALVGYTYGTNGNPIPSGHEYCVKLTSYFIDISELLEDIKLLRSLDVDFVAVFPHWGAEHTSEPKPERLRQVAEEIAASGADLIIGGHPKYIQPIEWFFNINPDGSERATLVIYSQGNFISNQHYPYNESPFVEYGLLLNIELYKNMDTGHAWIGDTDYTITWVHRRWRHRILPLRDLFTATAEEYNLSPQKVAELEIWYQRIEEVIGYYGHQESLERVKYLADSYAKERTRAY